MERHACGNTSDDINETNHFRPRSLAHDPRCCDTAGACTARRGGSAQPSGCGTLQGRKMGRFADAEPLYRRSLAIREKALALDHTDVATSLNGLALLYDTLRRYADAEPLYRRSLAIYEKALGPDHLFVATS